MSEAQARFLPVKLHQVRSTFILEWSIPASLPLGPARTVVDALRKTGDLAHVGRRAFTPLLRLQRVIDDLESLPPALFVFHVTRCGSTLLGRMLRTDPANRVFLEPRSLIDLLLAFDRVEDRVLARSLFRTLVRAYGLGVDAPQTRLVFKLASYCLFHCERMWEAFPGTPSVLLYRDPVEIMTALVREPATWLYTDAPGMFCSLASMTPDDMARMDIEEMVGLFLDLAFRKGVGQAQRFDRLLNYTQLPEAGYALARDVLGSALPPGCAEVLATHSKRPGEPFVGDSGNKQRLATPSMRAFADRRLYPVYEELERMRLGRIG